MGKQYIHRINPDSWKCVVCDREFGSETAIKLHTKAKHSAISVRVLSRDRKTCPMCNTTVTCKLPKKYRCPCGK